MTENEDKVPRHETNENQEQVALAVPSLATALQSTPERRVDWHLGAGVVFRLGEHGESSLELYSQIVRVRLPRGELAIPRREPQVAPEGVVFEDPEHFFLSVGSRGDVLFQYSPPSPATDAAAERLAPPPVRTAAPVPEPGGTKQPPAVSPPPAPETQEKPKSEKFVGRIGEVKLHHTKQGKAVAEVEITVADPERPGSSRLVKFAAFGTNAEALQKNYEVGQVVTAVGIPHELKRQSNGREWMEQQYYFVQLPKAR